MTSRIRVEPQPAFPFGVQRVVRIADPWHNDAFAGTPAAGMGNVGPRRLTWQCEDFAGNIIAGWSGPRCPFGFGDHVEASVTVEWQDDAWWWVGPTKEPALSGGVRT